MFTRRVPILIIFTNLLMCNSLLSTEVTDSTKDDPVTVSPLVQYENHRNDYVEVDNEEEESNIQEDSVYNIDSSIITNSHRPQYYENLRLDQEQVESSPVVNRETLNKIQILKSDTDKGLNVDESFDETIDEESNNADTDDYEDYKPSNHLKNKQSQIKAILVKLMEKNEQKRKFAQVLPILKMLTPPQRLVLASLVSKQITADAKNPSLTLSQVKAMFGNNPNITADLMLPIMLDIANMFRVAKDHYQAQALKSAPQAQFLRRSFSEDDGDYVETVIGTHFRQDTDKPIDGPTSKSLKIAAKIPAVIKNSNVRVGSDLKVGLGDEESEDDFDMEESIRQIMNDDEDDGAELIKGNITVSKPEQLTVIYPSNLNMTNQTKVVFNSSLTGNVTETLSEDMPVAEKLRALNRYFDRNGNLVVVPRPMWSQDMPIQGPLNKKTIGEIMAHRRRIHVQPNRPTISDMTKHKCNLFTNSLCLESLDYPVEAISASIRRNQPAVGALLADFPESPADKAIDGISGHKPDHHGNGMNRREDGQVAGSGFMCPSTVKYARPQKARATSGQWKYIVNTGEHTQTLRLEKCLRPRESCTYLTDNFKSKCVQVYNYHRLLTWDQQNGLHMDIFKVPTCCSCHIEGYSVAFPPLGNKQPETVSEHFPGEEFSRDPDINPFEEVQSSTRHTTKIGFPSTQTLESFAGFEVLPEIKYPAFVDESALLDFNKYTLQNQIDQFNTDYHTNIFQYPATGIRNSKKPLRASASTIGLPSFLEPPSKPIVPLQNNFIKTPGLTEKHKQFNSPNFKRGTQNAQSTHGQKRPNRRPLRKKNTGMSDDQIIGATSVQETPIIVSATTFEEANKSKEKFERNPIRSTSIPHRITTPKPVVSTSKITIKNVSPTTERTRPKFRTTTERNGANSQSNKDNSNRRINYNYHPIIDFFEESSKKQEAADRMDGDTVSYLSEDEDWRPMVNPMALLLKTSNTDNQANISG